jgi:dTMP kinase
VLITLEGIDGSGKSTLVASLRTALADLQPVFTREPGATWIGDQVRRAIAEQLDPITEALLFTADHAAHLATVVRPALEAQRPVISDRYTDSRYAYQAVTLEGHVPSAMEWLMDLHDAWTIRPDRTFLLVLPVDTALERIKVHATREHFERKEVLERVQQNYLLLAARDPTRFVIIDAEKEKNEICSFVSAEIRRLIVQKENR